MYKLIKVRKPEWSYGYGVVPAQYELHDETVGFLGTLRCQEAGYCWIFRPDPNKYDLRRRSFSTFREAHKELTRDPRGTP